jgi:VWFA-related protein
MDRMGTVPRRNAVFRWPRGQTRHLPANIFALAVFCAIAPAQQQTTRQNPENTGQLPQAGVIKVEAPSVVVDVIVTDKKGRHVPGLKAEDFAVYENNVPQKIVTFVPPLPAETPAGGAPSTAPYNVPAASGEQGRNKPHAPAEPTGVAAQQAFDLAKVRFITLVMDIGDLQPANVKRAGDAAVDYVRKIVAPEDFIAVYWIDHSLHLALPFTGDKLRAVQAVRKVTTRAPSAHMTSQARLATQQQIEELMAQTRANMRRTGARNAAGDRELATLLKFLWTQSTMQARTVFLAMRAIAEAYRDLPGRKNVVVFSEGFMHSPEAKPEMAAVIDAANRSNVAFYIVDAAGLSAEFGAESGQRPMSVSDEVLQAALWGAEGEFATGLSEFDWIRHVGQDIQYDDLGQVAQATGGFYVKRQNDLLNGLSLADRDLREFYTLVYQPTNKTYDGSFRKIKVELLPKGYRVRHRMGYWAIPPGEETMMTPAVAQLLAALASGSLHPTFAPEVNATLLLAPDGKLAAPVRVSMAGNLVSFTKDGELHRASFTLLLAARDARGRLASIHQRFLNLALDEKQWKEFVGETLDISGRLAIPELEPLRVQAILQFSNGAVAMGEREIAIPTPASGPKLTSLLLSDRIEPAHGTADPSDPLRGENFQLYLPAQPRFSAAGELSLYFGILGAPPDTASQRPRFRVSYAVKGAANVVMSLPAEEVRPSGAPDRVLVLKQFDPKALPPGNYTLEVTVEDLAHRTMCSQDADFVIR